MNVSTLLIQLTALNPQAKVYVWSTNDYKPLNQMWLDGNKLYAGNSDNLPEISCAQLVEQLRNYLPTTVVVVQAVDGHYAPLDYLDDLEPLEIFLH